ncbi:MAG: DUF2723 domain-containing protein [Endomicrobiales bacterium]|nr:DUF2723 domain-containing protein [Endomicrobiales bacterium]
MAVLLISFIVYLYTLFPAVAPYRDTGEMVSVAHTLGIAHPPGYPFYAILSKIFLILIPWGNAGYKMNVLSALASAVTVWLLYKILVKLLSSRFLAGVLSLLFASSYLQWYLSLVSEMYTLNTLFAALLIYIILYKINLNGREKYREIICTVSLFAFIFGVGLGNRMDLLLLAPGLFWILFIKRKQFGFSQIVLFGLFFIVGFSIYMYMPIRSGQGPFLDWNHPADLSRFWGSLTRKTHGGTLDLLSVSYGKGENFISDILFYFNHLYTGFAFIGLPLGLLGLLSFFKRDKNLAFSTLIAWMLSGPVFIYLANMPPNPHALAILEAHFLLPNLIFIIWIAEGFNYLNLLSQNTLARSAVFGMGAFLLCINTVYHFPDLNKRNNFISYDYSKNVLRSLPEKSVVVLKEDVQLFSLWNRYIVESDRPDLAVISQGLSGSFWYKDKWGKIHGDLILGELKSKEGWKQFAENNQSRNIYFTGDVEYQGISGYVGEPCGLVNKITKSFTTASGDILLQHIYPYRGSYSYEEYREFFTPDLIEEYSKSFLALGRYYMRTNNYELARYNFKKALSLKPLFPIADNYIGFTFYNEGNFKEAKNVYQKAVRQYRKYQELAKAYNVLDDVYYGIVKELADVYTSLGVCSERLGEDDEGLRFYQNAIEVYPMQKTAHFNKSVIYWKNKQWKKVISELESALKIDPNYQQALYYLQKAKENIGK